MRKTNLLVGACCAALATGAILLAQRGPNPRNPSPARTTDLTVHVSVDNYYNLFMGDEAGDRLQFISGLDEDPDGWGIPETHRLLLVDRNPGDGLAGNAPPSGAREKTVVDSDLGVVYIAAWSDLAFAQGALIDLILEEQRIKSGDLGWEVYATGIAKKNTPQYLLDVPSDQLAVQIQIANDTDGWVPVAVGDRNDEAIWAIIDPDRDGIPFGPLPGFELDSRWMWHDSGENLHDWAPFFPGFNHNEFLIFRFRLFDRPEQDG
ncbi:MAG: hypothetical protein R3236_02340 [Phycisphaeraceae bacterium]|nr:hypothetical protein [Phycisphaeraceae bacterium]